MHFRDARPDHYIVYMGVADVVFNGYEGVTKVSKSFWERRKAKCKAKQANGSEPDLRLEPPDV